MYLLWTKDKGSRREKKKILFLKMKKNMVIKTFIVLLMMIEHTIRFSY